MNPTPTTPTPADEAPVDLEAMEKLHADATPGKWTVSPSLFLKADDQNIADFECSDPDNDENNLAFCAAAHEQFPALIAEVKRLREQVESPAPASPPAETLGREIAVKVARSLRSYAYLSLNGKQCDFVVERSAPIIAASVSPIIALLNACKASLAKVEGGNAEAMELLKNHPGETLVDKVRCAIEVANDVVGDAAMLYHSADLAEGREGVGKVALRMRKESIETLREKLTESAEQLNAFEIATRNLQEVLAKVEGERDRLAKVLRLASEAIDCETAKLITQNGLLITEGLAEAAEAIRVALAAQPEAPR